MPKIQRTVSDYELRENDIYNFEVGLSKTNLKENIIEIHKMHILVI